MENALKELKIIVNSWMDLPLAQDCDDLEKFDDEERIWHERLVDAVKKVEQCADAAKDFRLSNCINS